MDIAAVRPPKGVDLASEAPLRIGAAMVDTVSREAQFPGGSERLQPQNLKVLIALARERGAVVTRERLVDLCWDGRFVGDDVINRAISTLRQFAERAGGFGIETVPRSGYRLVEHRKRLLSPRSLALAALALAACLLVGWLAFAPATKSRREATPAIALLPFTVASTDPGAREFATDARGALAHALAATQFRISLVDSASAKRVPVDFLMSGDVTGSGGNITVSVRMEEAAHHVLVYSERFSASRAQSAALAEQVGAQVAGSLGWTVSHLMLELRHPTSQAATALILRQWHAPGEGTLSNYESAREVAKNAPGSALAQGELAFAAAFALPDLPVDERPEALALGRVASARASALAPDFGDSAISWCALHSNARIAECEKRLRAGMRIDSNASWADWYLASHLHDAGLTGEALALARRSLAHDRMTPNKIAMVLRTLDAEEQTPEADRLQAQALRWWPGVGDFFAARVSGMIDRGDYGGIERLQQRTAPADLPSWYEPLAPIAAAVRASSAAGVKAECPLAAPDSLKSLFCISALAQVGELDRAFAIAAQRYPARVGRDAADEDRIFLDKPFVNGTEYIVGPGAAALRRDPRFLALAQRVGLLAYWRGGRLPDFCKAPKVEPICSTL